MRKRTATPNDAPALDTLGGLAASFAARGTSPAIVTQRETALEICSYERLGAEIERRTARLRSLGIGSGDFVALWAPNGVEWIAAFFGIVCAGAAAVPLDLQANLETVGGLLAHAAPKLLLTTAANRAELLQRGTAACPVLEIDEWCAGESTRRAPVDLGPDALASLVYTSGTTGTPKGVPLTHANLLANVRELAAADLIRPAERVLLPLPLHHTYPFTVGLLTVLYRGAAVVLPAAISGPEIARAAAAARATALLAVPRLCAALFDGVRAGATSRGPAAARLFAVLLRVSRTAARFVGPRLGRLLFRAVHDRLGGRLTLIGCGGAKLDPALALDLEALGFRVLTGYGLTETSPVLTFNERRHARRGAEGRALPGVELKIAAARGEDSGEILARGPSIFAGYWHNAAATAAAFTPEGWFRTGDLGWLDRDGYLHISGRSKELIVLADGKKLFPEELEKLYSAAPLIREIAIFERGGTLAALIVPDEQAVRERGALREAALLRETLEEVAARLPPYQRITDYRVVRSPLPRTQLGKLRRHLLADLYTGAGVHERQSARSELAAEDRALLASTRAGAAWQWLNERYPDAGLSLDTSPQLDLHVDSLGWVALTLEIEQRFDAALTGAAVSRILTVRDLLREIEHAPPPDTAHAAAAAAFAPPGALLRVVGALVYLLIRTAVRMAYRLDVTGVDRLPAARGYVIAPNHTSYLDPLVLAAALPWRQLRNVYWAGWVGVMHKSAVRRFLSRAAQVFPVDPDRDLASAVDMARSLLRAGHALVWFPEGRRSPTGELEPFQPGIGHVLSATAAPAVPTLISGTYAAWPKHRRRPRFGTRIRAAFGAPVPSAIDGDARQLVATLEQAVRRLAAGSDPCDRYRKEREERPMSNELESIVTLSDGRKVLVRPVRSDDVARNAAFIEELSPPSKHFLFLGGITHMSEDALRRLCDPDYAHDMAYVAIAVDHPPGTPERQVGVCRYAGADPEHGAEISVAVSDDWQHHGLGKLLLRRLIEHARAHGVRRLYSMDAVNNDRMRRLARHVGFSERPDPDDIHQVIYSLDLER